MDPPSGTIVVMLPENDMELGEPANVDKLTAGTNRETSSIPPSLELCEDTLGVIAKIGFDIEGQGLLQCHLALSFSLEMILSHPEIIEKFGVALGGLKTLGKKLGSSGIIGFPKFKDPQNPRDVQILWERLPSLSSEIIGLLIVAKPIEGQ